MVSLKAVFYDHFVRYRLTHWSSITVCSEVRPINVSMARMSRDFAAHVEYMHGSPYSLLI